MPASAEQYRQVVKSYLTRPGFQRLAVPSFFAWGTWLAIERLSMRSLHWSQSVDISGLIGTINALFILLPMVLLFVYTALVASQVRMQLSDPHAQLTPGFRGLHLGGAAVALLLGPITCVAVMLTTATVLDTGSVYLPGALAVTLTFVTPTAWWASWRSPWAALGTPIVFMVLIAFTPLGEFGARLMADNIRRPAGFAFTSSMLLIVLNVGFLRLLVLRLLRLETDPPRRSFDDVMTVPIASKQVAYIRHEPILSGIARIWHRRRGVLDPAAPWAVAIMLSLLLVGFAFVHGAAGDDLLRSLLLPACIPGAIVSIVWRERLMNLQFESLYPASHRNFINELIGAAALTLAEMWISTLVAVLVPIAIWHADVATHGPMLLTVIAASAFMQFFVFGVMLIASLRPATILYVNAFTLVAIVLPIAEAMGRFPSLSLHGLTTVALAEMGVGVLLTLFGTTAWRRADLA